MGDEHVLPFVFELLLNKRKKIEIAKHRLHRSLGIAAGEVAGDALQHVNWVAKQKYKLGAWKQRPEQFDFFAVVSDLLESPTHSFRDTPRQQIDNQFAKGRKHIAFGKGVDPFTRPPFAATENNWLLIKNDFSKAL